MWFAFYNRVGIAGRTIFLRVQSIIWTTASRFYCTSVNWASAKQTCYTIDDRLAICGNELELLEIFISVMETTMYPHSNYRLLHSPSLVAIGLLVGYERWPPIGLVGLNIDWDCLVPHCIMGSRDKWEFLSLFRPHSQSLCIARHDIETFSHFRHVTGAFLHMAR